MKRFSALLLAVFLMLIAALLSGCKQNVSNGSISVVCTIFPQYDWVRQILGNNAGNVDLTLLLDKKADMHSYQPSVEDIAKISSCDLFIYVGGESDTWVHDVLETAVNKNMLVINLLDTLGDAARNEEIIEGMEHEHEEDGEHESGDEHEHAEGLDEHVWLSLKNAQAVCPVIADALSSLDSVNAETYADNLKAYIEKLYDLDEEYKLAVNSAAIRTVLFADRFPFRYLVEDYGLNYHAAFPGCSAETEASFETIIYLAGKADELKLRNITVTESSDKRVAETVKSNTLQKNQQILVLDSMQSVSGADISGGITYIELMENNLNVLKEALK